MLASVYCLLVYLQYLYTAEMLVVSYMGRHQDESVSSFETNFCPFFGGGGRGWSILLLVFLVL